MGRRRRRDSGVKGTPRIGAAGRGSPAPPCPDTGAAWGEEHGIGRNGEDGDVWAGGPEAALPAPQLPSRPVDRLPGRAAANAVPTVTATPCASHCKKHHEITEPRSPV
ncbi:hypothetical protein GCM10025734_72420 [Kitasatospora paranensis]